MSETHQTNRLEPRYAPDWAWETIMETLALDSRSKAFDPQLRASIAAAYEAIECAEQSQDRQLDAMILWECVEGQYREGHFSDAFKTFGVCEMRSQVLELVEPCRNAYQLAVSLGFDDTFDMEFVPWFLDLCVIETPQLQLVTNIDDLVRSRFSPDG